MIKNKIFHKFFNDKDVYNNNINNIYNAHIQLVNNFINIFPVEFFFNSFHYKTPFAQFCEANIAINVSNYYIKPTQPSNTHPELALCHSLYFWNLTLYSCNE